MECKKIDVLWDDNPVDVTQEANFIWSIANKLRGTYMPDKYGDVIIPMTIIRRFECALEETKDKVVDMYKNNPTYPARMFEKASGFQFYCTSEFTLKELCNDSDHLAENFKSYIEGFSANVQSIMKELDLGVHIDKMGKGGCLLTVVKAFSELDLNPKTYDSIKMGYIFENLIGRFFQNVDAGQYYTGRDIIKMLVSVLTAEGCDDIFEDHKVITVCDQACGTGGMLSTAYSYLKHSNPTADIRLFGQEYMGPSYAIGLAEMLIKGQDSRNFRNADTFKKDCFSDTKMRFVIENPPFGTSWSGKDAKEGQEEAVKKEFQKSVGGEHSRWGAGLPSSGDSQLIFMQSAIDKIDDRVGRAAIVSNGSPLFSGGTSSGESQIRRWMLENDYIEAIISLPTELFYNTGIRTYVWILSKNKRKERKGKIQLIDASNICHKLRKGVGYKKNEITKEDRLIITGLYSDFDKSENSSLVKIFNNTEFIYREYTIKQPLQRSYGISAFRINNLIKNGHLINLYDEGKIYKLENSLEKDEVKRAKELKTLANLKANKEKYDELLKKLNENISTEETFDEKQFTNKINNIVKGFEKGMISKIVLGLSLIDKTAPIIHKKGKIILDPETKDSEFVKWEDKIEDYMVREVFPHVPDANYIFEGEDENATFEDDKGRKTIKIGAEIPFEKYFYKHEEPRLSEEILYDYKKIESKLLSIDLSSKDNKYSDFKKSGVAWAPLIPESWEVMPNKYIMKKTKVICPIHKGEEIISLSMNGVVKRDLDAGGKMPTSFDGYQFVYPGNLLMCLFDYDVTPRCIGFINDYGITSPAYSQFIVNNQFSTKYYYYYYLMIDNTKELLHLAKNLRHSFTEDELGKINQIVPSIEEQENIASYLDKKIGQVDEAILLKKKEIELLEEYKKSIVYEYTTGKKEVPNE